MAQRPQLELADFFPYLINRVGFALVAGFTGDALDRHHLSIAMWRVLAALSNNGQQRQIDLADMTSIDVSTLSRLVTGWCVWVGDAHALEDEQPRSAGGIVSERPRPG